MKTFRLVIGILVLLLATIVIQQMVSAVDVTTCSTISSAGSYVLTQAISSVGSCLNISANDVILNCQGFKINYGTGAPNGATGIYAIAPFSYRNLTIQNCIISKAAANGTTSYGIQLYNINDSVIFNNTIKTNGTNDNYGIYLTANVSTTINSNVIVAAGNSTNNYGIFAQNGLNNSIISNNVINTSGNSTNYGVYLLGTTNVSVLNTSILSNIITTKGNHTNNFGIFLSTYANANIIENNTIRTNGTLTNYGIHLLGAATSTINNTEISYNTIFTNGSAAATTNDYGIFLSTGVYHSNITLNAISAAGPTRSFGIHLTGTTATAVNNNSITYNNITSTGTGAANWGIHLTTNANHNIILGNTILTTGTTTDYGIHFLGVTTSTVNNNTVSYNVINTSGTGASNFGIFLSTNTSLNNISSNNITVNGSTTNYGINLLGAASGGNAERNVIYSNLVRAWGSSSTNANIGVILQTYSNHNVVRFNNLTVFGITGNYGIQLSGTAALPVENNTIDSNSILLMTNSSANFGVYLITSCNFNNVNNNTIVTNGTTTDYGIHLLGTTAPVEYNEVYNNNIRTGTTGASNHGIYLLNSADNNEISHNVINVTGTTTNHGIILSAASGNYLLNNTVTSAFGTTQTSDGVMINSASHDNLFENNVFRNIVGHVFEFTFSTYSPDNNVIKNNSFSSVNLSTVRFANSNINNVQFIDQIGAVYNFTHPGSRNMVFEDSRYGRISFSDRITGNSSNLSRDIQFGQDYIFVNLTYNPGLNTGANIRFYNITDISDPIILKDGVLCPGGVCWNQSSLVDGVISLNVMNWSNYSVAEAGHPAITLYGPANDSTAYSTDTIDFNFSTYDILSPSSNCTLYLNSQLYATNTAVVNNTNTTLSVSLLNVSRYIWNISCINTYFADNVSDSRVLNVIAPSNIAISAPANNSNLETRDVILRYNLTTVSNDLTNVYLYGDGSLLNTSSNIVNATGLNYSWSGLALGNHTWYVISSSNSSNYTTGNLTFRLVNVSVQCFTGGPYQAGSEVLISGNLSDGSARVVNQYVNATLYKSSVYNASQNISSGASGDFQFSFLNVDTGDYVINVSSTYLGFNKSCSDSFSVSSGGANATAASLAIDKFFSLYTLNQTSVVYNITLRAFNLGGSNASNSVLIDANSPQSPYSVGTLVPGQVWNRSYLLAYTRNSTTYNVTLAIAALNGTDTLTSGNLQVNSSQGIIVIPSIEANTSVVLTKNAIFVSENSSSVTYNLTLEEVNSGGSIITSVPLKDGDLALNINVSLNISQHYFTSGLVNISKGVNSQTYTFSIANSTVGSTVYSSNQISVLIPGMATNASLLISRSASLYALNNTGVVYNLTIQATNIGGRNVTNTEVRDSSSTSSPYSIGTLTPAQSSVVSYLYSANRLTSTTNVTLAAATVNGTDALNGNLINSSTLTTVLSIPGNPTTSASFVVDKIVDLASINATTIVYNVSVKLTNKGGSDMLTTTVNDSDAGSNYVIGTLSAGVSTRVSYLRAFARQNNVTFFTTSIAQAWGNDSYTGLNIQTNASRLNVTIPSLQFGSEIILVKNADYNSDNSTAVNYSLSLMVVNSGGTNLSGITVIDSDLGLTTTVDLNQTQNYTYSGSVIVPKAANNQVKDFVQASATAEGVTYKSNSLSILIPGYGGPADAIVYAPSTVNASADFDSVIQVLNQNPDAGQDFVINYWITNESENRNYSSGEKTVYVAASGQTNTTVTLAAPSGNGAYRLRGVVTWAGGTATAYDSFEVIGETNESDEENNTGGGGSSGGGGGGGNSEGSGGDEGEWDRTYDESNQGLEDKESFTQELASKERVKFKFNGETHQVGVLSMTQNSVTIEVASMLQHATLIIGESKQFELNGDGFYDLNVKLNSISNKSANLSMKYIHESVSGSFECNTPYIWDRNACCLDKNNNSICDHDERSSVMSLFGTLWSTITSGLGSLFGIALEAILAAIALVIIVVVFGLIVILAIIMIKIRSGRRLDVTRKTLTKTIGMSVYSTNGIKVGRVIDVHLEDVSPRVYCWIIKVEKGKFKNKKILVKQKYVVSIRDVMLVKPGIVDYLAESKE